MVFIWCQSTHIEKKPANNHLQPGQCTKLMIPFYLDYTDILQVYNRTTVTKHCCHSYNYYNVYKAREVYSISNLIKRLCVSLKI